MSVINKTPFLVTVLTSIGASKENLEELMKLINGGESQSLPDKGKPNFRSLVNRTYFISSADKGVFRITLETKEETYTGYFLYNSSYCVLIAYGNKQYLSMLNINPVTQEYEMVKEYLDIDELRSELNDLLVAAGELIEVGAEDINSGDATAGQVLAADGEGGAEWTNITDTITEDTVEEGDAVKLFGFDSEGNLVADDMPEGITVDETLIEDSPNAVSGGAVYDAIQEVDGKIDTAVENIENGTIVAGKSLTAEQLENVSEESGTVQDEPFIFQATGCDGGLGSTDTAPIAKQLELRGKTYALNQLVPNANKGYTNTQTDSATNTLIVFRQQTSPYTSIGSFNMNATGEWSILASASFTGNAHVVMSGAQTNFVLATNIPVINGRTYLLKIKAVKIDKTTVGGFETDNLQVFDLTLMFNGNIPTEIINGITNVGGVSGLNISGVAIFNSLFPETYYAYGSQLVSSQASKLVNIGYNQFDGELEIGTIDITTGQDGSNANHLRSKNYIRVVSGQKYTLETDLLASQFTQGYLYEYDENKNYLGYQSFNRPVSNNSNELTLSNNTHFIRFRYYGTTNLNGAIPTNQTCFHFTWDSSRTGYEEYVKKEYDLPNEVLRSAGNVYDEIKPDGTKITRIGVVDLGTLDWNRTTIGTTEHYGFYTTELDGLFAYHYGQTNYFMCSKYQSRTTDDIGLLKEGLAMWPAGQVRVYDASKETLTGTEFKTAMSGVYLVYELAEPTTSQVSTFAENVEVDDFGTMQFVSTYPQGNAFFYPADYVLFIDSLYNEVEGDVSNLALKSELTAEENAREGYDAILLNAVGGTLRQMLAQANSIDFLNTAWVDLGTLNWAKDGNNYRTNDMISLIKLPANDLTAVNGLCTNYKAVAYDVSFTNGMYGVAQTGYLYIRDTTYADATAFKNAMKGVLLAYEKA